MKGAINFQILLPDFQGFLTAAESNSNNKNETLGLLFGHQVSAIGSAFIGRADTEKMG